MYCTAAQRKIVFVQYTGRLRLQYLFENDYDIYLKTKKKINTVIRFSLCWTKLNAVVINIIVTFFVIFIFWEQDFTWCDLAARPI